MRAHVAWLLLIAGCSGGSDSKVDAPGSDGPRIDAPIDAPTVHDTCAGATTLTFANGFATATASTVGAADDTSASCGGSGGPDVVYKFTTSMVGTLLVDVRPTSGSGRAVVSLRSDCGNAATEFGGCVASSTAGGGMLQIVRALGANTYYLWIDSADGTSGQFEVSLQLTVAAGDSCAGPIPLAFTSSEVNVVASTIGSTNDESATCGGASGLDNVFRFDLTAASNFEVTATPKTAGMQPIVYLQTSCVGSDLGCAAAPSAGADAFLRMGGLATGTHYLWVDGANATPGLYNFTARLSMPGMGDTCALASPLTFTNGMATATGDTSTLFHDGSGTCASGTAPDAVYTFTTTSVQNLRVDVTTTSSTYQPVVYLRSTTCTGGQLACGIAPTAGGTGTLQYGSLPIGTYYLWVDGSGSTAGPFTLTALLGMPTQGDTCALASPLTFTNGMATATGNTSTWFHDSTGTCATGTAPDGVYTFTTTTIQDLRIAVSTTTGTYQPAVYVRSASCTGTQLGCGSAAIAGGMATLDIPALPIGTYYVWIDGVGSTAGAFSMTATLGDPAPGDHCTNPTPLTFTGGMASATGTTVGLFNDGSGTCATGTAPDVVYSFTTATVKDLRVTVSTTTGTYQPAVYLRSASCAGTQVACSTALTMGGTATLDAGGLAAGTYYLWIDGVGTSAGAYSLNATLSDPLPGDHCTNTTPLVFSSGMASATGTTVGSFNDGSGTCATGTASDVIYSFTTTAVEDLRVTVNTTTGTYQPVVYLRSASCTAGTQLGCGVAAVAGGSATLAVGALPVGTYYLWIDGVGTTAGAYSLTATLSAPQPGERCTNPTALMFTNGMAGGMAMATGNTTNLFDDSVGTCGGTSGPDAVYSFTTDRPLDLTASVSTTTGTYRPVVYLRSTTCTGTQVACAIAATAGGTASLTVQTLPAGTYFLWVDSATATGGAYTVMANLVPLPPAEVRPVPPQDVTVPGPMAVGFDVVDRLGFVVNGDNTTRFTVNATGSAVFTSATQGSIISGMGTGSVVVQVSAGRIALRATDATAETVTYTAVDSQANGLVYPSGSVTQMAMTQTLSALNTFSLPFAQRPSGNGTLTITAFGDFDLSTEYLDVFMESTAGTSYGSVFVSGGNQCTSSLTANVTIPQAQLMTHLMDGIATIVTRPSTSVSVTLCTSTVGVTLSFPTTNSAMFLP